MDKIYKDFPSPLKLRLCSPKLRQKDLWGYWGVSRSLQTVKVKYRQGRQHPPFFRKILPCSIHNNYPFWPQMAKANIILGVGNTSRTPKKFFASMPVRKKPHIKLLEKSEVQPNLLLQKTASFSNNSVYSFQWKGKIQTFS